MNICSNNHDEVCYEGRNCPTCDALVELENTQKELENAKRGVMKDARLSQILQEQKEIEKLQMDLGTPNH